MERIFDQKLRQVQRRLDLNRFLAQFGELLLLVGAATLVCALVEKALGVAMFTPLRSMVVAGVVVAALVVRWGLTRPSRMEVALASDERLALRERFSTTLALAAATDPFAAAARSEAIGKVAQVDARRSFPIALTTRWAQALVCCAAAGAVFYFMPTYDLLGYEAKACETATEATAINSHALHRQSLLRMFSIPRHPIMAPPEVTAVRGGTGAMRCRHDFAEGKLVERTFVTEFEWHGFSFSDSRGLE